MKKIFLILLMFYLFISNIYMSEVLNKSVDYKYYVGKKLYNEKEYKKSGILFYEINKQCKLTSKMYYITFFYLLFIDINLQNFEKILVNMKNFCDIYPYKVIVKNPNIPYKNFKYIDYRFDNDLDFNDFDEQGIKENNLNGSEIWNDFDYLTSINGKFFNNNNLTEILEAIFIYSIYYFKYKNININQFIHDKINNIIYVFDYKKASYYYKTYFLKENHLCWNFFIHKLDNKKFNLFYIHQNNINKNEIIKNYYKPVEPKVEADMDELFKPRYVLNPLFNKDVFSFIFAHAAYFYKINYKALLKFNLTKYDAKLYELLKDYIFLQKNSNFIKQLNKKNIIAFLFKYRQYIYFKYYTSLVQLSDYYTPIKHIDCSLDKFIRFKNDLLSLKLSFMYLKGLNEIYLDDISNSILNVYNVKSIEYINLKETEYEYEVVPKMAPAFAS